MRKVTVEGVVSLLWKRAQQLAHGRELGGQGRTLSPVHSLRSTPPLTKAFHLVSMNRICHGAQIYMAHISASAGIYDHSIFCTVHTRCSKKRERVHKGSKSGKWRFENLLYFCLTGGQSRWRSRASKEYTSRSLNNQICSFR